MLDGPLIFVDVDTQRDFLEPGGALFIAGSAVILDNLARLTGFARSRGIPVLATACAHLDDDPEFDTFPPHCLLGTPGQARVGATEWPGGRVLGLHDRLEPDGPIPPHLTVHKAAYDVFSRPDADTIVAAYARDRPTFVVYGVATDYCVRCAVAGLLDRGQAVALVVDAIRPVDAPAEAGLLTEFARRGVLLTLTEVVTGPGR